QAAVGETLQAADADPVVAEGRVHAGARDALPFGERRERVYARLELAAAQELLVHADVGAGRHVLHARDAEARGVLRRGARGDELLVEARLWGALRHERLRRVLQHTGRLARAVAHDASARWIRCLARDAR